jgi:hypothetical protein
MSLEEQYCFPLSIAKDEGTNYNGHSQLTQWFLFFIRRNEKCNEAAILKYVCCPGSLSRLAGLRKCLMYEKMPIIQQKFL